MSVKLTLERQTKPDPDQQSEAGILVAQGSKLFSKCVIRMIRAVAAVLSLFFMVAITAHAATLEEGLAAYERDDYLAAKRILRPLAEQDEAVAQLYLGLMYLHGNGLPQNDVEAFKLFHSAGEQGNVKAQFLVGAAYYAGTGVEQDDAEAVKWYQKAAEQGDEFGQFNLGYMYDQGRGVQNDQKKAAEWYLKAAEQGNLHAQVSIGNMYALGQGVQQDFLQAYKWLYLVVERGWKFESASLRYLAARMKPEQVSLAKQMAKEWMNEHEQ